MHALRIARIVASSIASQAFFVLLSLSGCTDEQLSSDKSGDPQVETYESLKQVPICNPLLAAHVYYIENEQKFYYCDGKQLQPLDLHGQDGKDGKDGTDGKDGV